MSTKTMVERRVPWGQVGIYDLVRFGVCDLKGKMKLVKPCRIRMFVQSRNVTLWNIPYRTIFRMAVCQRDPATDPGLTCPLALPVVPVLVPLHPGVIVCRLRDDLSVRESEFAACKRFGQGECSGAVRMLTQSWNRTVITYANLLLAPGFDFLVAWLPKSYVSHFAFQCWTNQIQQFGSFVHRDQVFVKHKTVVGVMVPLLGRGSCCHRERVPMWYMWILQDYQAPQAGRDRPHHYGWRITRWDNVTPVDSNYREKVPAVLGCVNQFRRYHPSHL